MHTTVLVMGTVLVVSLLFGFFRSLATLPYKGRGFPAPASRYDTSGYGGSDLAGHSYDGGGHDGGGGDGGY
jgi:hypothetical protein